MRTNPGYYTSGTYYGTAGDILALAVGESIRMMALVHWPNQAPTGFGHRYPVRKSTPGQQWRVHGSTVSSSGIGHRTSPPLAAQAASARLGGSSWTGYALYLFPNEIGIGKFQPYGRYTGLNSQFAGALNEFELGLNYVIAGHNARISTYWRTGNIGGTMVRSTDNLNYAPGREVSTSMVSLWPYSCSIKVVGTRMSLFL